MLKEVVENKEKKKLSIEELQVESFVSKNGSGDAVGGWTGNCLSFMNVTCPDPNCDFPSAPIDECTAGQCYTILVSGH